MLQQLLFAPWYQQIQATQLKVEFRLLFCICSPGIIRILCCYSKILKLGYLRDKQTWHVF